MLSFDNFTKELQSVLTEIAADLVTLSGGSLSVQAHIIGSVCVGRMHPQQTEKLLARNGFPDPVSLTKQINNKAYEVWTLINDATFSFENGSVLKFFISEMNRIDRENKEEIVTK